MNSTLIFKNYAKEHVKTLALTATMVFVITFLLLKLGINSDDIQQSILYIKACLRSWLFVLPDSWMNIVESGDYRGNFLSILKTGAPRYHYLTCSMVILSMILSAMSAVGALLGVGHYYLSKSVKKMKIFGEVLNIERYQQRHKELFGKHLELAGLEFSDLALKHPIFLWADDIKIKEQIKSIIDEARIKNRQLLIFEDGDSLYKDLFHEKDILLNPFVESGYGWNLLKDFQANENIAKYMQKNVLVYCDEYLQVFKESDVLKNIASFLQTLCFGSTSDIGDILEIILPKSMKNIDQIRSVLAEEFEAVSSLITQENEVDLTSSTSVTWVSGFNKNLMQKLSRFILETSDDNSIKIVLQKESHSIKKPGTIVVNSSFNEFHTRFDGSFLALGNTENNKDVATLFGQTSMVGLIFGGTRYHNINYPAVSEEDLAEGGAFFKYHDSYDVLRL